MRQDESGAECPETLGEYLQLCKAIGGPDCRAVEFLEEKIAASNPEEPVIHEDSQMRYLLMPLLIQPRKVPRS